MPKSPANTRVISRFDPLAVSPLAKKRRAHRGRRSQQKVAERMDRWWSGSTAVVSVPELPGRYSQMKANGPGLIHQLVEDVRDGSLQYSSSNLHRAPSAQRYIVSAPGPSAGLATTVFLRKFSNIIDAPTRDAIQSLWDQMIQAKIFYASHKGQNNRSSTPALHLGVWEKYGSCPRSTEETRKQNKMVTPLMETLLEILAVNVAPRMVAIMKTFFPGQWERQLKCVLKFFHPLSMLTTPLFKLALAVFRAYHRVQKKFKELEDKPFLDFKGVFFAVAIKEGASEVDHLDWSDDRDSLTWVTGIGQWIGADLRCVETGHQFPVAPGEAIVGSMRTIVHSTSPIESGRRITITMFTERNLMKHALEPKEY